MRELRDWISEKMRRRPRRGPNNSESTGKSGQELPTNQPAPLRPAYPDELPVKAVELGQDAAPSAMAQHHEPAEQSHSDVVEAPAAEPKIEVETQPESL